MAKAPRKKQEEKVEAAPDVPESIEEAKKSVKSAEGSSSIDDIVSIQIPVHVKIKRKVYHPGVHKVPRHVAEVITEMVDKKIKSDLSMFTGKNYSFERLLDRSLVIKESK